MDDAKEFFQRDDKADFVYADTGYRPFGSETGYANLTRAERNSPAIYEYFHLRESTQAITRNSDLKNLPFSWTELYSALCHRAKQDYMLLGIPLGAVTMRLLHYPPQLMRENTGAHLDFDYLTYVVGSISPGDDEATIPNKYMVGEMAQMHGDGKATLHKAVSYTHLTLPTIYSV